MTTDIFPRCGVSLVQVPLESSQKNVYIAINQGVKAMTTLDAIRACVFQVLSISRYYHGRSARILNLSAWATGCTWNENIGGVALFCCAGETIV